MPRLASLYLPNLAVERLRREERRSSSPERFVRLDSPRQSKAAPPRPGEDQRIECSVPNTSGFRPGARWARAEVAAQIDALPPHQRPPMRELGRRTEAAKTVFRSSPERGGAVVEGASRNPLHRPVEEDLLVLTARSGQRVVLAAACPAAQALGLSPGMALTQARALVPGLDVRAHEPEKDAAFLARLGLLAARRWTPRAAVSGADGLWLDLSGVAHLFGGEEKMARRILALCARLGLTARIAVAGTIGAAHALARHGGRPLLLCPSGAEAEALQHLALSALRIDEAAAAAARRLGIDRIGDLLAMPRAPLQRRFGKILLDRLDRALGRAPEPFDPIVPEEPPEAELRFAEPIGAADSIAAALGELVGGLVRRLEEHGLGARLLDLACDRVDGAVLKVRIGTARATRDGEHLLRLLRPKIEAIEPGFGIDSMRLSAPRVEPLGPQAIAGDLADAKPAPDLVPLIDRLAGRLGARRLYRMSALESDVPERSATRVGPLAEPAAWPEWPRPVRLLSPPERIENVVALLPDQPPRRFTWRGRSYRVAAADGPERIHGEWWRRAAEADSVRDYFQVEAEGGARFWLFRRGDGEDARTGDLAWYLHGVFG